MAVLFPKPYFIAASYADMPVLIKSMKWDFYVSVRRFLGDGFVDSVLVA